MLTSMMTEQSSNFSNRAASVAESSATEPPKVGSSFAVKDAGSKKGEEALIRRPLLGSGI